MPKRKLPKIILSNGKEIDLEILMVGMEDNTDLIHWFLNIGTGEVESYSEDYPSLEQFERDMERIENDDNIKPIPKPEPWEAYEFMKNFNEEVAKQNNGLLYEKLLIALDGKGAFRRFKDVLHDDREMLERWYQYKEEQLVKEVRGWLESLGVDFKEKN